MKTAVKKSALASLYFASFMFLQFVILRMGNQAGRGFLPDERQEKVYIFLQVFVICGIALHAVLNAALKKESALKAVSAAALAFCGVCFAIMLFAPVNTAFYLTVTFAGVFCLGYTAGRVYLLMSGFYASGLKVGACMGIGYSAALLLQFFLQLQWFIKPAVAVLALCAFAALGLIFPDGKPDGEAQEERAERVSAGKMISACVIAAGFLSFTAFYSGYIHRLQIASGYTEFNVYTWPRLLMIPGMLAFGLIGDHKKGRLLPLVTLCFSVVALLNAVLAGKTEAYRLNMCLYYIALSAAVAYYDLTFWKLAPGTKNPAVWSVAGRVIDSITVIPFCLVSLTDAAPGVVLSLNIAALAAVIAVMAVNGDLDLSKRRTLRENTDSPVSEDEAMASVAERYKLTPSELRVFRSLVLTEDKQSVIAEKLSVKLRTVQANVTPIYRKTGVATRSGLLQIYHDVQK